MNQNFPIVYSPYRTGAGRSNVNAKGKKKNYFIGQDKIEIKQLALDLGNVIGFSQ